MKISHSTTKLCLPYYILLLCVENAPTANRHWLITALSVWKRIRQKMCSKSICFIVKPMIARQHSVFHASDEITNRNHRFISSGSILVIVINTVGCIDKSSVRQTFESRAKTSPEFQKMGFKVVFVVLAIASIAHGSIFMSCTSISTFSPICYFIFSSVLPKF